MNYDQASINLLKFIISPFRPIVNLLQGRGAPLLHLVACGTVRTPELAVDPFHGICAQRWGER